MLVIFNPVAGRRRAAALWKVLDLLVESGIKVEVAETQYAGHATLLAREAARAGRRFVVLYNFPNVDADAGDLRAFLEEARPRVLNVAGLRESSQPGIAAHVAAVLAAAAGQMPAATPRSS